MFLSNLLGSFRRTARKPARRQQSRAFRPCLEQLEDRRVLSTVVHNGLGWTSDGLWHPVYQENVNADRPFAKHYALGAYSYDTGYWHETFGPDGPWLEWISTANSGAVTSPPLNAAGATRVTLVFWESSEIEYRSGVDRTQVQVSTDGGTFWTTVFESHGTNGAWEQRAADLSPYVGGTINVRFHFDTVDAYDNNYRGWWIDDAVVYVHTEPAAPAISVSDVTVTEGNAGTAAATFTVSLSAACDESVAVSYASADDTASGGSDYQAAFGTLTFAPGELSKPVTVLVEGDRLGEPNENFFVNLSNAIGASVADSQGVGTIEDDEPRITIIDPVARDEGNSDTTVFAFTVRLSAVNDAPVTVAYATANGSAAAGSDYLATSGTLTIAAGQTSGTINVLVNGDRVGELNEIFFVNLNNPGNALIADGQAVGTIQNDEPSISITDVVKAEGKKGQTTSFTFTVTLSAAYDQAVTLSFRTVDGTARTSDGDYIAKSGTLTFAPGETTKTITIEVKGDSKREADETFALELFGASSNALLNDWIGAGRILNDD